MKILFLNPPGKELYIRDYYCSKVSKAYYLPQPVDLLMQTSFFNESEYDLKVIDAIAERISIENCLSLIKGFEPDFIIGLIGSVSLLEDELFYKNIHDLSPQTKIFCSGDLLLESSADYIVKYEWLTGIITDFYKPGVISYINGKKNTEGLLLDHGIEVSKTKKSELKLDIPKHHLFNNIKYRMPFASKFPMATILTNYACPFPCTFCIMSHLEFKTRSAENIIEELKAVKKQGIKFIYFSDQTFYTIPKVADKVLDFMIEEDYGIEWMCFSRVDITTKERLIKMKKAGCKVIMYGVEWAENELLKTYKKQYTVSQIRETFKLSKELGFRRVGTFLIGVPGQSRESIINTIDFAKEIEADYASFNVAVPRVNTSFRDEAIDQNLITEDNKIMDQSGSFIAMGTGKLDANEVMKLKKLAYLKFYLRPGYIIQRIRAVDSWTEFKNHLWEGWYVLRGILS
jgi:radical SAM superfamily enzyme YgiQ (UPF0313 family)